MSYYGVRINVGNDIYVGTPVEVDVREVRRRLLETGPPAEGDNLIVFASDGEPVEGYDLDAGQFVPCH